MAMAGAALYAGVYGVWSDPAADEVNRGWVRAMGEALRPLASGCYVGEADLDAGPDAARRSYSDAAWRRLAAVRRSYDPDGRFFSYPAAG
jgi:FAD/FMN-containing dehydrogenase